MKEKGEKYTVSGISSLLGIPTSMVMIRLQAMFPKADKKQLKQFTYNDSDVFMLHNANNFRWDDDGSLRMRKPCE